ncbi:GIP [Symbiodinium sp. CCMP2456]|nr:GIP [Symbiodinium sp. CCMP2456]
MGGTKGPSERLIVPSFSGDTENGGDLGSSARSYLRQVSAWEKMTKLAPDQRALVLYQHLAGSAWVNSESLSVDELASPDGVNRLREWVRQHYLDVEVTQVGRSLSDLFRKLRRRPTQSFRDYAAEFNRLLARVVECGCALPDVANACLFVDRANLDEATEVSLLASVGNKYALRALQSAAIVLDRSMRKPWEKAGVRPRTQNVNHAEGIDETNASDSEMEAPTYDDPDADAGDLYVSYMTAKARYKEATKARGVETRIGDKEKEGEANPARRAAENKIALAKAKSHCSACGQKGHWHRDEVCPKFGKGQSGARTQTIHVTNEVYELCFGGAGDLMAILDTACSKTVVGTSWFQKYLNHTKGGGYDAELVHERESFKFGAASKIYESTYAAVIYIPIASQVVAVKASVIHGGVPLLMSKPALTRLGLILDLSRNVATFRTLQSGEIALLETHSGHPALKVDHSEMAKPDLSRLPTTWEAHGIEIVSHREVYMIGCTGDGTDRPTDSVTVPKIFYDKKIDGAVRDMLTSDLLNEETFSSWWATTEITNDFWLEIVSKVTIRLYGLAAVSSTEPKHPLFRDLPAMVAVWQMTKGQLIAECNRRELAISPEWTCPELRTILMADMDYEKRNTTGAVPKKLSGMNLSELREEAIKMNLPVHDKESKGTLMLRIRDAAAPSSTVMTVGRFRGTPFNEVPESYGAWASEEERQNGDNMHTDLKRFVNWRRHMRAQPKASMTPPRSAASYLDVETYASVPPPPMSETGSSYCSGERVERLQRAARLETCPSSKPGTRDGRREGKGTGVPSTAATRRRTHTHGAGDRRGDADGDPCPGDTTGDAPRSVRFAAPVSPGSEEIDEKRPLGAHAMHHEHDEGFQSCSSGSEDLVNDAFYVSRRQGPGRDHPGEQLARQRLQEGDFSGTTFQEILSLYDLAGKHQRRQGIHGLPEDGGRATFGYYAYGTFKGITKRTLQWPHLTAYLNGVISEYVGGDDPEQREPMWSSIALLHNCPAAMHTDKNNVKGSHNFVVSFGQGEGGDMWVQESGGGVWRRDAKGHEVEGRIVSTHEQGWEFDPRLRHCTETFHGERWFIAGFTARTYPDSNKEEKKLLRELGFPLPSKSQLRCDRQREEVSVKASEPSAECPLSSSTRPRKSCRRNIRKTALLLSVLLTTVLSTMAEAAQLALLPRSAPSTPLLEVGGISATCRLAEYGICGDHLVEPIVVEDVLHNDHPSDCDIGYLEAAVMKHEPGQLWIHVKEEFGDGAAYNDLVEAVSYQLGAGRSVVFEKEIDEPRLWHDLVTGWESAGYSVRHDYTANGNESIHVIYDEQESYVNTVYAGEAEDGRAAPHRVGDEGEEDQPMARGAQAIRFPPSVPSTVAASLRRLHQNLGHPSVADFVRHLRLAGASREVLKAARNLECQVCQRTRRPAIAKPAKVASCFRFNEMIGTDLFYIHDSEGQRHQLLSIVDFSSAYHVVVPVARKDTPTLERAFCENWINIFGAPSVVAVDMENGLEKSLGRISDWTGTRVRTAAGQAHHQAGYTERQGAIWKEIFQRVCEEQSVVKSDIHLAIGAVSSAKNQLTKTSGFSPCQHVFGTSPGVPEDLLDGPHALPPGEEPIIDDRHAREVALRTAARAAYFHVQTDERVRRALAGRARVEARTPETGERVFYYRKTKNNKKGTWVGPGTIIGQEGANLWVTRGGRCVLCAPEHVRLATAEELGQAFSLHIAQQDLDKLLNADSEQEDMFIDGEEENADGEPHDGADEGYGIGEIAMDIEEDPGDRRGVRRELARVPPMVLKRQRRKGRGDEVPAGPGPHEAHMLKKARTPRSKEKQLEKEIPWAMIPEEMRPAFRSAEAVQWKEHVDTGALEVLDLATSDHIRQTVAAERILSSRFAYRDKHMGRRRADPTCPWKPKSRLVVGGHQDPDVGVTNVVVDSPTVSRASLLSVLQVCASKRWSAAAGDVQAAFLQGVELQRELWLSQPKSGIDGLHPRQLARIRKGVFGLSESPRMWYDRLSSVLLGEVFEVEGKSCRLIPSPLDPCVLMLLDGGLPGEPLAYICIHVDDLLLVAPKEVNRRMQKRISELFPIDSWLEDSFEYTGSFIEVGNEGITINQASFVDGRLFTVDVPRGQDGAEPASTEQAIDNRSLIGALSWLSSQSRPDLLCGVTLSQQLQRAPLTEDVRFVNQLKVRAEEHRGEGIYLHGIPLDSAMFLVYHDAAWANAELEDVEEGFQLSPEEIDHGTLRHLFSEDRPRKPKRGSSKVASQLGHLVFMTDQKILNGEKCRSSLLEWRSQSCKRVCRSTFGAETMAAVEGLEGGQYMRALLASLVCGRLVKHEEIRERWPMLCLSDCKSLHDYLHKAGTPRLPADRRLAIDLAALRQELRNEQWGPRLPLQWIPTEMQLADPLTKPMRAKVWWETLKAGILLPLKRGLFQKEER